jgi:hypothetical protein
VTIKQRLQWKEKGENKSKEREEAREKGGRISCSSLILIHYFMKLFA